jgi:hypothetical protein
LERAIKAHQDSETDASSLTQTPTERSASNEASPPSSASSTPRITPVQREEVSSCCQPKPIERPVQKSGGCCGSKSKQQLPTPAPAPAPVKSCCSSKSQPSAIANVQSNAAQPFGQQFQFQIQPQFRVPQYQNFPPSAQSASFPYGLGAPIYNHAAAAYQQPTPVPIDNAMRGSITQHNTSHQVNQHDPEHNCHCGESCSCFGCAAHPNNATMMEYVRLMAEFQYTGGFGTLPPPLYDLPTYPHHPGFGAEASPAMNFGSLAPGYPPPMGHMGFQASIDSTVMSSTPVVVSTAWEQPAPIASATPVPQFLDCTTPTAPESQKNVEVESATSPVSNSPSDTNEEETPTLSPSAFFWNEMVLPGCNDATGTCQCGDGCECVGCLTHGGHNGVPLEAPTISDHEAFPAFTASAGLGLDHQDSFMTFATSPS